MPQPAWRSRNAAHRNARAEAYRNGAAKIARTLSRADAGAVQATADESGRPYVAVVAGCEPGRGWWFVVHWFRPRVGAHDDHAGSDAA